MRITIVQGAFLPVPPILGGTVEKVWYDLGREFARHGHEVLHISRRHPRLPYSEIHEGVRYFRVRGFNIPRSPLLFLIEDLLYTLSARRYLLPADIIVSNTHWLPVLVRAAKFGRMFVHVANFPRGQLHRYRHTACLQATTSTVAAAIRAELGPKSAARVCVIPNPLAHRASPMPPPIGRAPVVLYSGRLHQDKGVGLLINAWHHAAPHLPGWRLRIVGSPKPEHGGGGGAYLEYLKREAGDLPVDFVDQPSDPATLEHEYRNASFFVYPAISSNDEAFDPAPLEAMAFGLPVIASRLDCFHDFLLPEENALVFDHGDGNAAGELAKRIVRLATEHELRLKLGNAAWETTARYTGRVVAEAYLAKFVELL